MAWRIMVSIKKHREYGINLMYMVDCEVINMGEKIFVKNDGEECMYCPSCGNRTLHMNSEYNNEFACSECSFEAKITQVIQNGR